MVITYYITEFPMASEIWIIIIGIIISLGIIELVFQIWISLIRKKFQWLITAKDEKPILSNEGLTKFISLGYDSELGWVRKPNTAHNEKGKFGITKWSINEIGARSNPGFEEVDSRISCYGDSFTFSRQVNDDETWEHYLSDLEKTNVKNFAVGNYGIDQSILRLKREYPKNQTQIVILAVVPDTISRIMSVWKHYYEYGNTFAFKPRFVLKKGNLELIKNKIDSESKFENYLDYLDEIKDVDFFYKQKFQKEIIKFPFMYSVFRNFKRNFSIVFWITVIEILRKFNCNTSNIEWNPMQVIMNINLKWRLKLFNYKESILLLKKIIEEFVNYAKENKFLPIFIFLPQKDDIFFIQNHYNYFYSFEKELSNIDGLNVIPMTEQILHEDDIDKLYSDDNEYGGHFSKFGNKRVAKIIHNYLTGFKQN